MFTLYRPSIALPLSIDHRCNTSQRPSPSSSTLPQRISTDTLYAEITQLMAITLHSIPCITIAHHVHPLLGDMYRSLITPNPRYPPGGGRMRRTQDAFSPSQHLFASVHDRDDRCRARETAKLIWIMIEQSKRHRLVYVEEEERGRRYPRKHRGKVDSLGRRYTGTWHFSTRLARWRSATLRCHFTFPFLNSSSIINQPPSTSQAKQPQDRAKAKYQT